MNTHYTYLLILVASIAGPLVLSFDKKVAFYTKWKYVFQAMILPAVFYIAWDIFFTFIGVWSFNPDYITGIHLINLPIEEVMFFLVVPYCCTFIYECIRCYFPAMTDHAAASVILKVIAAALFIAGIYFFDKSYTGYTFILTAVYIAVLFLLRWYFTGFHIKAFLISYAVILIPFLIVNGFLTAIPVVLYNDAENLGLRIYTIPFEDAFYGMLLVMMNISIFEKLRSKHK
ncbi:MAG TPA: lycopene cyclase domain-containing protein [Ferruginibacter sp.]|nr:lycopene cyclase domain-containing protein [Ferruginibacter sp.]